MIRNSVRGIIFDFDFTLADASRGIVESINYALERMGLVALPPERILPTVGLSLHDTLRTLAGDEVAVRFQEFHDYFVHRADEVMAPWTVVFPGTHDMARTLHEAGYLLAICSNKYRYRIQATLVLEGLAPHFAAIIGAEDVTRLKPDPEAVQLAMCRLGTTADDTLYVGDSPSDAEAAQRAGVEFVAVRSPYTTAAALAPYPVSAILDSVGELPNWLAQRR